MGKWSDEQARIAEEQRVLKALDHMAKIAEAERAIVDAADALRSEVDGECVSLFARRQDKLFRAVDAWRKLKGEGK